VLNSGKRVVGAIACVVLCICSVQAGDLAERGGAGLPPATGGGALPPVSTEWKKRCTLGVGPYNYPARVSRNLVSKDNTSVTEYVSGMPVEMTLCLQWSDPAGTSGSNVVTQAPPEKWYESVEFEVSAVSGDKATVLRPVLMQESWPSDNRAEGKAKRITYWVIRWQDTENVRGDYRATARWQGVVSEALYDLRFRGATSAQERAYMCLARADVALRYEGNAELALGYVQDAVKHAGGYVYYNPVALWDSGYLLGAALRGVGRYSEAVAAYEEQLRTRQYAPGIGRYDSVMWSIAEAKNEEAAAKVQFPDVEWKGEKAGDVETLELGDGVLLKMVWCPSGSYVRGSPEGEAGRFDNESQHEVTITKGFWIAQSEVTIQQWLTVMGSTSERPGFYGHFPRPKALVTWDDCQNFINRLNARVPDGRFRLPTEAEWEYACRAGTATAFHGGDSLGVTAARFYGSTPSTNEFLGRRDLIGGLMVRSCQPNAWGLYDMHGNVWEWCQDWYGPYPTGRVTDPVGPASGTVRVNRGGGYYSTAEDCRSARRHGDTPSFRSVSLGFRLVMTSGK
jgi:sulfatase modifying factor 1